jgi:predicted metal-binding protein
MTLTAKIEPAPWSDVVLVCAKCAAKLGRGRKGRSDLRGEIKQALKQAGLKGVRVADVGCLDLCPKGGQTVAVGRQMANGRLTVVGPQANGAAVVRLLLEERAIGDPAKTGASS